ncbi:MAG: hypothetical protein JOZ18_05475 [Chloroflexi bacterium]|nr:hypothetical protein [Chloroflexota bacterium]
MKKQSRRRFIMQTSLSTAALTTASALGVVSCAPEAPTTSQTGNSQSATKLSPPKVSGPVVAYVRDFQTGEISLLAGSQEIIFRDSDFVQRLLKTLP